jgi:glutamate/tyrosine decarboxylase-like PLP-dependent enzyme
MHMPIEVGCVLVRHRADHHRTFAGQASYLAHLERGVTAEDTWLTEYGPQLSRGFRALKVWMAIQEHGIDLYGRLVEQNVEQARYLARRIEETPELELLAPVPLNIVCFRFRAPGLDAEALDRFNADLLGRLHESGVAVPTFTRIHGAFAIRVAITNHRSRREDFDLLVSEVVRLGREALAG